jgi:hypothetical protein
MFGRTKIFVISVASSSFALGCLGGGIYGAGAPSNLSFKETSWIGETAVDTMAVNARDFLSDLIGDELPANVVRGLGIFIYNPIIKFPADAGGLLGGAIGYKVSHSKWFQSANNEVGQSSRYAMSDHYKLDKLQKDSLIAPNGFEQQINTSALRPFDRQYAQGLAVNSVKFTPAG